MSLIYISPNTPGTQKSPTISMCSLPTGVFSIEELYSNDSFLELTGRKSERTSWLLNFKEVGLIGVGKPSSFNVKGLVYVDRFSSEHHLIKS